MKFKTLIAVAIIEGFTASTLKAADFDDLNVLDLLADNIITLQNKEANTPPPLEKYKQTRFSAAHARISALPDTIDNQDKSALGKILRQFSDLKIPNSRNPQKASIESITEEPNTLESQPQETETLSPGQIDLKTLEALTASAKDPNSITEPLALAQTLYRAGYTKEASLFFEIAAHRTIAMGRVLTQDDKAWILLQLAACRRNDPKSALEVLDRLLTNYPKSIWASAAVAERDILHWYQKDNPRKLLEIAR